MPHPPQENEKTPAALLREQGRLLADLLARTGRLRRRLLRLNPEEAAAFEERSRAAIERLASIERALAERREASGALSPPEREEAVRLEGENRRLAAELAECLGRIRTSAEAFQARVRAERAALERGRKLLEALRPWKEHRGRRFDSTA